MSLLAAVIAGLVVLIALALWLVIRVRARRRSALTHDHVRFADEDKPTLVPSETPGDVHIVRKD
jgi:Mg2+/citrate symporter